MRMIGYIIAGLVCLFLLVQFWVRFAPLDTRDWHIDPQVSANEDLPNGVLRVQSTWPDGLARLDAIIMQTPRTRWLAGSVRAGIVTYETRSLFWGFPDYTTVMQADGKLEIFARARFGRSDMGVNKRRVTRWLEALKRAREA